MRGRNEQLVGDIDLLQTRKDVTKERHCAKIEEVVVKVKMVGAIWLKENTIRRHPDATPSLEWFRAEDNDESLDSSDNDSDGDGQA